MIHALVAVPFGEVSDPDQMRSLIDDAGPVAFAFIVILGIALFFLGRSLVRQVKRVDPSLPAGPEDEQKAADRKVILDAIDRGARSAAPASGADPAPGADPDPGDPARS